MAKDKNIQKPANRTKSSSIRGALRKYANPELIKYEKDAWAEASAKKQKRKKG